MDVTIGEPGAAAEAAAIVAELGAAHGELGAAVEAAAIEASVVERVRSAEGRGVGSDRGSRGSPGHQK